ncbi:MAG: elongation factor Ts [Deltaproteobacteria bacterium]|nr:MAG: elongation factor Ts [Deltaproteobacteria bacterium]TDJ21724.1 MAG: elongation factor Ts [Deltaproteobacteria bacterium]
MAQITAAAVKALRDQTGAGMMDCKKVLSEAGGDASKAVELLREKGLAKAGKREGRATSEGLVSIAFDAGTAGMVEVGCETDFVARTDDFSALVNSLATAVAADTTLEGPEKLLEAMVGGKKVADRITAAIAKLGENIQVKRVARVIADDGTAGGYVHTGGRVGVIVALRGANGLDSLAKDVAMHVAAADPSPVAIDRDGVSIDLLESERKIYRNQAIQAGKPEKVIDKIVEGKLNKFLSEVCLVRQAFVKDPDKTVGDLLKQAGDIHVVGFQRFKLGEASEA